MSKKKKVTINATFEYQRYLKVWTLTQCTYEGELNGFPLAPLFSHPKVKKNTSSRQLIEISGLEIEI